MPDALRNSGILFVGDVARGTHDFHRANIIGKSGARNTADVIRRVFGRRQLCTGCNPGILVNLLVYFLGPRG